MPNQPVQEQAADNAPSSKRTKTDNNDGVNMSRLSHSLSWALRHAAPQLGLTMTSDGYVPVSEILSCKHKKFKAVGREITLEHIERVVQSCQKQRFKLDMKPKSKPGGSPNSGDNDEMIMCIRANQGHSIKTIDADSLLQPLTRDELLNISTPIIHGTYLEPWEESIKHIGLSRMKRQHIHFATGLPDSPDAVISGMRKSCQVFIYVDASKCAHDNIQFYRSDNGVLLTAGVDNAGMLPTMYFAKVTTSTGDILWTPDG